MLTGLCDYRRHFYTMLSTWFHQQVPRISFYSALSDIKFFLHYREFPGERGPALNLLSGHTSFPPYVSEGYKDEWAILPFCFCVGLFG